MTTPDTLPGPCQVCGMTEYSLSFGGPNICPWCDCEPYGGYRLQIGRLQDAIRELADAATAVVDLALTFQMDYAQEYATIGRARRAIEQARTVATGLPAMRTP